MPGKLTFLGLAKKILSEEERPLSPAEIWKTAESKGYSKLIDSESQEPIQTLYSAILTNTRDHPEVLFHAKEWDSVDWDTLNKLTMNTDIQQLLLRVKNDLQTKEIIKEQYDKVLGIEELHKLLSKKGTSKQGASKA